MPFARGIGISYPYSTSPSLISYCMRMDRLMRLMPRAKSINFHEWYPTCATTPRRRDWYPRFSFSHAHTHTKLSQYFARPGMRIYSHAETVKALSTVSAKLFEFNHEKIMRVARIARSWWRKRWKGDKKARTKEEGKREATSSLINEEAKQLAPQR